MADNLFVGKRVVEFMSMTKLEEEGWNSYRPNDRIPAIAFDDGSKIYPSMDDEGNGPGAPFGVDQAGATVCYLGPPSGQPIKLNPKKAVG
jgi:hypothetical protein